MLEGGRRPAQGFSLAFLAVFGIAAQPIPPRFTLPDDVAPKKYTVTLTIDPGRATFEGEVSIDLEARKQVSTLWLNAKGLSIMSPVPVYANDEFVGFQIGDASKIVIRYSGRLDDRALIGPYRRKVEGEWYAYTTFTPIDARRAFPCFDEPRFKVPWDISIRVPRGNKAFSNAPQISKPRSRAAGSW